MDAIIVITFIFGSQKCSLNHSNLKSDEDHFKSDNLEGAFQQWQCIRGFSKVTICMWFIQRSSLSGLLFYAGGEETRKWDFFGRLPFPRQWEGWLGFKPLMKVVRGWWLEGAPLMKVVRRGNDRLWKRGLPPANKRVRRCSATPSVIDQYILQGGDLGKSCTWQAEVKSQNLDLNHIYALMYFGTSRYVILFSGKLGECILYVSGLFSLFC